jgi:hypothetical protein
VYNRSKPPPWETASNKDITAWARDEEWLNLVAATPERDLRGHRIALTYHALAIDLFKWIYEVDTVDLGSIVDQPSPVNANWFNFSTWATATLNADIRNDGAPYGSDRLLPFGLQRQLTPTVLAIKSANRQRYSQLLTWYQRLVFINTTFAYNALRARDRDDADFAWVDEKGNVEHALDAPPGGEEKAENPAELFDPDDPEFHRRPMWVRTVKKLAAPPGHKAALKQRRHLAPVAMAFEYYRRARLVTLFLKRDELLANEKREHLNDAGRNYFVVLRARLIFFANLIITSVEQDVVDPGVERVLDNVPTAANAALSNRLADMAERVLGVPRQLAGVRLPVKLKPAEDAFREVWVRVLTRELLILALPAETLRLGHDIPPLAAGEPYFPEELWNLSQLPEKPAVPEELQLPADGDGNPDYVGDFALDFDKHKIDNARLQAMVWTFDRSRGDGHGTGARDWRRIAERMNWATTLVRSRIQDSTLFWAPYRNEDVERIYRGQLPLHTGNPTDFDVLGPLEGFDYLCGGGETRKKNAQEGP